MSVHDAVPSPLDVRNGRGMTPEDPWSAWGFFPEAGGPDQSAVTDEERTGPEFTVSEAALACQVDRRTIRRRLEASSFPNAHKLENGRWRIPVVDLIAAGLKPNAPTAAVEIIGSTTVDVVAELQAQLAELQAQLADALKRAAEAEARAEECGRVIDAQTVALRARTTGTTGATSPSQNPDQPLTAYVHEAIAAACRPRWWRRLT
jgi:hypothetical protein